MIETVWSFYKNGVRGFGLRIYATSHPYLSGLLALGACYYTVHSEKSVKFSNFLSTFVTYNTVVFGFTATAIALAIAIPSVTFLGFLSNERNGRTAFRDFLFVLAWNGVVHIFAFYLLMPAVIFGEDWILNKNSDYSIKFYTFMIFWSQFYVCLQFLVTTIGVFEMGDLYAAYISKNKIKISAEPPQK